MSPSELQSIVDAIHQGATIPWWSYVLIPLLSVGVGAYFSSYLKRKGEDRAAKEHFDTILTQLRKATEATEAIKVPCRAAPGFFNSSGAFGSNATRNY